MWAGAAITGIGSQMTIVAVGLDIYDRTASTLAVSLVAAFALVPMIVFGLYGGILADSFDRRRVALLAAIVAWGSTAAIAVYSWAGSTEIWPLYLLITLNTIAATMVAVARHAMVATLVRTPLLPAAGALSGISAGVQLTVGPALAGISVAYLGFSVTYTVDVVLFLAAFLGLYTLPAMIPDGERRRPGIGSVIEGWQFLRRAPNIRASFVLDVFAMTFGNPRVLFPAVGALLIGGGAITVGILSASSAVGMLVLGLLSGRVGSVRAHGRGMIYAVVAYGAAVMLFGVVLLMTATLAPSRLPPSDLTASSVTTNASLAASTDFAQANLPALLIAATLLALAGAADTVSMIYRTTMIQAAVPDVMRGRLQGLFTVVVTGGPRVGDLYVGVLSLGALLWFPPLLGGLVIIVAAAVIVRVARGLREYDALDPQP
jgi:MFS family permease